MDNEEAGKQLIRDLAALSPSVAEVVKIDQAFGHEMLPCMLLIEVAEVCGRLVQDSTPEARAEFAAITDHMALAFTRSLDGDHAEASYITTCFLDGLPEAAPQSFPEVRRRLPAVLRQRLADIDL